MPIYKVGYMLLNKLDQGWVEIFGGQGFIKNISGYSLGVDDFNLLNLKLYLSVFFIIIIIIFTLI